MAKGRIEQEIALKVTGREDVEAIDKKIAALEKKKAKIEVDVDAGDAEKKVASIDKKLDELKSRKAKLTVEADFGSVERDIEGVLSKVDKLSQHPAELLLTANMTAIESDIAGLVIKLDTLDDPHEIAVTAGQLNALNGDLDQVTAKLREVSDTPVTIDTSRAEAGLEGIAKSAGSSKSVLANMVGNATQDLGALGGVAGSAGVAIGQMGEYMVDASADGDKLGDVLRNFAAVAGPIAVIAAVVGTLSGVTSEWAAAAEASKARAKQFGEAMDDAGDDALGLSNSLRDNIGVLREFDAAGDGFGAGIIEGLAQIGRNLPFVGGFVGDAGRNMTDLIPIMEAAGLSIYDVAKAIEQGGKVGDEWSKTLLDAVRSGKITEDQYGALSQAIGQYGGEAMKGAQDQKVFNVAADEANSILQDLTTQADPLQKMGNDWATLMADMADGTINTVGAADAINRLAIGLGLTREEVIALAQGQLDENMEKAAEATEAAAAAQDELQASLAATNDSLDEAAVAMEAFGDTIESFDPSDIDFSLMAFDTVNAFDDVKEALEGAQKAGVDWSKVDLTPDSVDELKNISPELQKVTESIAGMRDSIQTELKAAFDTGGIDGFREKAAFFAAEIGGQFKQAFMDAGASAGEADAKTRELLEALGLLPEQVEIQIKLSQAEAARKTLEIFKADIDKLPPEVSTEIKTLWAQGSTVEALQKLNAYMVANGLDPIDIESIINPPPPLDPAAVPPIDPVDVPVNPPDMEPSQTAVNLWVANANAAQAQAKFDADPTSANAAKDLWIANANAAKAQAEFDADPANAQAVVDTWETDTSNTTGTALLDANGLPAADVTSDWKKTTDATHGKVTVDGAIGSVPSAGDIARRIGPVEVIVTPVVGQIVRRDAGGSIPPEGGIAGETGPEFVRLPDGSTTLVSGATFVPPGSYVTSRRRTKAILSRQHRGLPRFANGGVVPFAATEIVLDTRGISDEFAAFFATLTDEARAAFQEAFPPNTAETIADAITPEFAAFFATLNADQQAAFQEAFPPGAATQQAETIADAITPEFADFFAALNADQQAAFQAAFPPGAATETGQEIAGAITPEFATFFNGLTAEARAAFQEAFPPGLAMTPALEGLIRTMSTTGGLPAAAAAPVGTGGELTDVTEAVETQTAVQSQASAETNLTMGSIAAVLTESRDIQTNIVGVLTESVAIQSQIAACSCTPQTVSLDVASIQALVGALSPPAINVVLDGDLLESTAPAVRAAAMTVRAGRA